jgi:hypothetical protein
LHTARRQAVQLLLTPSKAMLVIMLPPLKIFIFYTFDAGSGSN